MGAGATKTTKKEVHLDCEPSHTNIILDPAQTTVIKDPTVFDVHTNTVVSDQKLDLNKKAEVEITCKGGGVLRIGLTATDPSANKNILGGSVFETEEGFSPDETRRILYKSAFNYIYFGPRNAEREYEGGKENGSLWLYVIYVYGSPEVKAKLGEKDSDETEVIQLSPLAGDQNSIASNTVVCKTREPILNGDVYHCHWDMNIKNEIIADTPPCYGYMSLKLVSRNKGKEEVTVWERSSAVKEYPFSSVIAFCLSVQEKSVSHNLLVNSVGQTKKEHFKDDVRSDNLHFVIEFSSGQVDVTHARTGLLIRQDPGSILLVKNYKTEEEDCYDLLLEIVDKIDHKPRRLQFGDSPVIFVLEFNERLTDRDINDMKHTLGCQIETVEETHTVQVLTDDMGEICDEYEIEQYFSREKAGGGEIGSVEKDNDIPGCWIIRYDKKEIARNIWMTKTHTFTVADKRVNALAFPVFKGLGLTVNNGEKPKYDTTPLVIDVSKEKLRFVLNRSTEKKAFVSKINKRIEVDVIWSVLSNRTDNDEFESEFEEDNTSEDGEEEPSSVTFECKVPESEGKKLAVWKDITRKAVSDYFSRSIYEVQFHVGDDVTENVLDVLQRLQEKNEFEYEEHLMSNKIRLFGSDEKLLKEVADKAGKPIVVQEDVEEQVKVSLQQYLALDAEGILDDVKNDCPYTSFKVDRGTEVVSLKGPKDEVQSGNRRILKLALDTKTIGIPLQEQQVEFLEKGGKNLLKDRLRNAKLNNNFTVTKERLDIMTYTGNNISGEKRKKDIVGILENLIQSCSVSVDTESLPILQTYEWKRFKKEIETRADGHVVVLESKHRPSIDIIGTKETTKFAKVEVENYLKCNGVGKCMFRVPIEVAEYLDEFSEYRDNLECVKDSNGCHTGELSIHGANLQIGRLKDTIEHDSKKVNIHWFFIKKTWIASVIQDLVDLRTLSHNEKFLLQVDIGHSLAVQGVTCVAVYQTSGTVIQVRQGDITFETTNVIVNNTNGHEKSFDRGLGRCLVEIGGEDIKDELLNQIRIRNIALEEKIRQEQKALQVKNTDKSRDVTTSKTTVHSPVQKGKAGIDNTENVKATDEKAHMNAKEEISGFKVGDVIETTSGRLRCIQVMHAFGPKWVDGSKAEEKEMKCLITKILQLCQDKRMTSVAIPAISCGGGRYPLDKATTHIVEAVTEFIDKTKGLAIKEVVLCDSSKTAVDNFTQALGTLKDQWFVFQHGRKIEVEDMSASLQRKAGSQIAFRPLSGRQTASPTPDRPKTPGLKWGRQQAHYLYERQTDAEINKKKSEVDREYKDGLPYNIPVTDKLTLHVKRGDLTKQTVNVIVSTTPEFPDLKGEVANAVIKAGGDCILQECKPFGSISEGQMKATGPGRLNCDKIYHVVISKKWNPGTGQEFVHTLVSSCLKEAINSGYSSVAFPTIGTGKSGFPPHRVANSMIKAICETGNNFRRSSLTDVTIVVYSGAEGVCKVFEEVVPLLFNDSVKGSPADRGNISRVLPRRKTAKYVPPHSFEKHTDVDDVVIVKVVSTTDGKVIQKQLEDIVEKQFVTKKLNFQELSKEQALTESEESALKTLQLKHGINVEIDKNAKCVKLTGLKKRVDKCEFEAIRLLAEEFPSWRLKERNIRTVAESVQWYYGDDDGKTHPVDVHCNYEIHTNYLRGVDFTYFNSAENKKYRMIIGDMSEHPVDDPSKRRSLYLRTRVDSDIGLPDNWSIYEKGGDVAAIKLNENEAEFNDVKDMFLKGGCRPSQIVGITRLENKFMWLQYQTKKKQLEAQNKQTQNERRLWHGTNIDTVLKIIRNGYDRNFAGNANMTAHGKGVYFAASSSYSNRDQYAARDANGVKRMFWNRVLTGVLCQGNQNMATLPLRQGVLINNFQVYYDCAVDEVNNPGIFVIFHDTQAYPEYLIEYT